jgi:hypothetical protein
MFAPCQQRFSDGFFGHGQRSPKIGPRSLREGFRQGGGGSCRAGSTKRSPSTIAPCNRHCQNYRENRIRPDAPPPT